jgi:hypothetical protein
MKISQRIDFEKDPGASRTPGCESARYWRVTVLVMGREKLNWAVLEEYP